MRLIFQTRLQFYRTGTQLWLGKCYEEYKNFCHGESRLWTEAP